MGRTAFLSGGRTLDPEHGFGLVSCRCRPRRNQRLDPRHGKLSYLTIEQDEVGGTVAKYPRQKLVMTSPVELPLYGKFKKKKLSKEELITLWKSLLARPDFSVRTGEKVEDIQKGADGIFTIISNKSQYRARAVILGLGLAGNPRN